LSRKKAKRESEVGTAITNIQMKYYKAYQGTIEIRGWKCAIQTGKREEKNERHVVPARKAKNLSWRT